MPCHTVLDFLEDSARDYPPVAGSETLERLETTGTCELAQRRGVKYEIRHRRWRTQASATARNGTLSSAGRSTSLSAPWNISKARSSVIARRL